MAKLFREPQIKSITFSVLSPDEITRQAVVEVDEPNLYSKGLPTPGAANDLRLGSVDRRLRCSTCKHGVETCMGHPGKITLAVPVVHWLYLDTVVKILRCCCFWCQRIIIDPEHRDNVRRFAPKTYSKRVSAISVYCKNKKKCHFCGGPQPDWTKEGLSVKGVWPESTEFESDEEKKYANDTPITVGLARDLLSFFGDDDCRFLGLRPEISRPEWMILTVLIVPPPLIRPTTALNDGSRCKGHDDLTTLLRDVVKSNNKIKESLRKKEEPKLEDVEQLTIHLATYFDKDGGATTQITSLGGTGVSRNTRKNITRSGPVQSLGKRLAGKRGRFRGNITGKRVNFTSRSVITPEPHLDIWQLAIPLQVARTQTLPITVTPFNRSFLRKCVLRGDHPKGYGAHSVTRKDGTVLHLGMSTNLQTIADALETGWVVRRHLRDGDSGLFNRQPSLHKMSMMGHYFVIHDKKTFGLPVPTTPPYNADFDGDEMNLHVFQSLAARAELEELMSVPTQLISPKNSKPCINPVQDSVIASYTLTSKDTFLDRAHFFDLTMQVRYSDKEIPEPAIMYRTESGAWKQMYTGRQLLSYMTPPKVTLSRCARGIEREGKCDGELAMDPEERFVVCQDGEMLSGRLCKATIGSVNRGFIHRIVYLYGGWKAAKWISDLQRAVTTWFSSYGFSIGMDDCVPSEQIEKNVRLVVDASMEAVKRGAHLAREAGVSEDRIESERMRVLSDVMLNSAKVVLQHTPKTNRILQCIESGSKGKKLNICQILGVLGQQVHTGKRIFDKTDPNGRTLSSFSVEDMDDPITHGLVKGSYFHGLDPESYFFHCMTGREGLIDTACKTAETGYLQRRIGKLLESEHVASDYSVRDADNNLIEVCFGGDGIDPEKQISVPFPLLKMRGNASEASAKWCGSDADPAEVSKLANCLDTVRRAMRAASGEVGDRMHIPFDPEVEVPLPDPDMPLIEWANVGVHIEEAVQNLNRIGRPYTHFECVIRGSFVCKRLGRVSEDQVRDALLKIVERIQKSVMPPGSMCGLLAAQSIGEPATQMTLNTFHSAGSGNKTVARGVPRFKELIDTSKNPATPGMTLYFRPGVATQAVVSRISGSLATRYLRPFIVSVEVLGALPVTPEEDSAMVDIHEQVFGDPPRVDWSGYVGRVVLDKDRLIETGIRVSHVCRNVRSFFSEKVQVVTSTDSDDEWVMRIRIAQLNSMTKINQTQPERRDYLDRMATSDMIDSVLDSIVIGGMRNVEETYTSKKAGEFIIETDGSSLAEILSSGDLFDTTRCTSNTITEVMSTLGVDATHTLLFRECADVLGDSGEYVAASHLNLLTRKMTHQGQPLSATRHGMKRANQGVLVSASFERTVDTFVEAAVHAKVDNCNGVTECIVMNRLPRMGTGYVGMIEEKKTQSPEAAPAPPKFIGRRRGAAKFAPKWDFGRSPEQIFRVVIMREQQRPFTPPPEPASVAWGVDDFGEDDDEIMSPEPDSVVCPSTPPIAWGPPSPPSSDDEIEWIVNIRSPKGVSEMETKDSDHALVPWIARPTSPLQ